MDIFPNLKNLIKNLIDGTFFSNNQTRKAEGNSGPVIQGDGNVVNIGNGTAGQSAEAKAKIVLTDLEKKILTILAEGARAVPALDEKGCVCQVNMYGHPEQNSVDCVAPETLSAYRALLRRGLIAEDFSTGKREYAVTGKGSSVCE